MHSDREIPSGSYQAVFFDLDGTLVDTAPDMVAVLSRLLEKHGRPAVPFDLARNNVSNGAVGLLRLGFPDAKDNRMKALHSEYLADYANAVCIESAVFPPLSALLERLTAERRWGIVTNKPERMTTPLVRKLGLSRSAACIVSGDTLPQKKPDPAPLLHAAQLAGIAPERALYVGDAARDIEAGRAAGMATVAVGYGYVTDDDDPQAWGADAFAADTMSLTALLRAAVGLEP